MNYTNQYSASEHHHKAGEVLVATRVSGAQCDRDSLFEPLVHCNLPQTVGNRPRVSAKGPTWILALIALVIFAGGLMEIGSSPVTIKGADSLDCPLLAVTDSGFGLTFEQRCFWASGVTTR